MKHARSDYQNRIVDLAGKIPENEPVFLLRAKDICSLAALHSYLTELVSRSATRDIIANVNAALLMFSKYQKEEASKVKLPDIGEPENLPVSDSPILQKALNEVKALEEKNSDLVSSFNRVVNQVDEYANRYTELKRLQENTVKELGEVRNAQAEANKLLEEKGQELTKVKFDLKTATAANDNLRLQNETLLNQVNEGQKTFDSLQTEIETLKTALQKEVENNAV